MIKLGTNTLAQLYVFYKQQQTTQPSEAQQSQAQQFQSQSQVMDHVLQLLRILTMLLEVDVGQKKSTKISSVMNELVGDANWDHGRRGDDRQLTYMGDPYHQLSARWETSD
ncbi:hypothetical protein G4B88_031349 [Cannabis sativa]|uniref:Uncharacterized protein n=1 Tax=Cannabis sativa TaxID=3483 RepID=A0A7J6GEQ9_CANSA|nr:hypothetical protein G4B88_031349 [Cannabis sativa]